ncbi:MAG: sigma-54-dependent Fis family transcriptional regulator [Gammaproteobacteria bacterium]|jgi:two-component system response regulator FlrC|nr:sigma-54-dependent Fis family transcriptional regulator [Gammaproteobacteria bacterium]MBT3490606.1 sigma-54-dependent Fis family transcriptional regulator [Gammaproteobacteria bacterium]MBT3718042.1 sigma-54-dependent Fis family transcriptional regulator [Gammaproteobacteria bacterium]MBT3844873.1 sigma-54-dependent Fis family transcriptional regulator [Gammaproteobacteria bacterium]MBT3891986.1 sigma-54-dependent Fis family transcriptional regulator [Gammaproteobacteria bacterium]
MNHSKILIVEDDPDLREALVDTLELSDYEVLATENGFEALEWIEAEEIGLVFSDVQMDHMDGHTLLKTIRAKTPHLPVVLMTAYGTIDKAVEAMNDGAVNYLVKPFEAETLLESASQYIDRDASSEEDFVANDEKSRDVRAMARRVAESEATIMIMGESGTGKEVLSRYVHKNSKRSEGPFVAINCAAIPENMLEAMLFGYEKGSFTGAYKSSAGKFEQAQGGTILLDEISEMDLLLQAKLLRVLQEKEVERLGGREPIPLDVRVLCTTNRDMKSEVQKGRFREDLFYRLNVFPLELPALRDRPNDIIPIAKKLLERHTPADRPVPLFAAAAEEKLKHSPWPGNIRELENVVQRAMILSRGNEILAEDLLMEQGMMSDLKPALEQSQHTEAPHLEPLAEQPAPTTPSPVEPQAPPLAQPASQETPFVAGAGAGMKLKEQETQMILDALESSATRQEVSDKLGISPRTLRYKIARLKEAGHQIPG